MSSELHDHSHECLPVDLADRVRAWIVDDPDPSTQHDLTELLALAEDCTQDGSPAAREDLSDRFAGLLEFGTAGLRGQVGAGPNRMNRAVVIRAAAGLADYLRTRGVRPVSGESYRVAVGFDARHRSDDFASDTAAVLCGAGIEVEMMPRPLPTPLLAWAVRNRGCDAGVMVTASHNPPQDNGYKVYLGGADGGTLIVPPADSEIARRIAAIGRVSNVPRAPEGSWQVLDEDDLDGYYAGAAAVVPDGPRGLRIVTTALHGVGGDSLVRLLGRVGFADVVPVSAQAEPDPDFPTVAFPNPEEPGAIDLAIAQARHTDADLVIANDPDADRCAVAVRDPLLPEKSGFGWRMLRGDELGAVLAQFLAPRLPSSATLACSIVSSTLLGSIAADHGLGYARTLTGFKWIARAPGLGFGYEEALGYCVAPDLVRDKDGLTAALLAAHIAAELKAEGRTLIDVLSDLAGRHGLHATDQLSLRVADLSVRGVVLQRVLANPPSTLGGQPVLGVDDLAAGSDELPPTEGLRLRLPDGWVIVRPSGTEPKLKAYLEVVRAVGADGYAGARVAAAERLAGVRADLAALLAVD